MPSTNQRQQNAIRVRISSPFKHIQIYPRRLKRIPQCKNMPCRQTFYSFPDSMGKVWIPKHATRAIGCRRRVHAEIWQNLIAFTRSVRCIDNTLLWDSSISGNFVHVCKFLTHTNSHGIIYNLSNFFFCQQKLDYFGFTMNPHGVVPAQKYLKSIFWDRLETRGN